MFGVPTVLKRSDPLQTLHLEVKPNESSLYFRF